MTVIIVVLAAFALLETLNIVLLYGMPGSKMGNAVGVFRAYRKAQQDPEVAALVSYLVKWVAGTKLIFVALIVVIIASAGPQTQLSAAIALVVTIASFYLGLYPILRRMDMRNELEPRGYSRKLGLMIGGIMVAFTAAVVVHLALTSNADLRPWPQAPLYTFPDSDGRWTPPASVEEAMAAIEGRYAHYDVVAYQDETTRQTMRTFIVSYGFTEFHVEDGQLVQTDSFCSAEQILNRAGSQAFFSDAATQAIRPREQIVELSLADGTWTLYRPPSPTLLGITGDPDLPLSTDPNDPNLIDPDGDGNPGVTVTIRVGNVLEGEIYITRREIYSNYLELHPDGNLYGYVIDESEQFVVDASRRIFRQESNMEQIDDPAMSPILLVRVGDNIASCADLAARRDELFPPAPSFDPPEDE